MLGSYAEIPALFGQRAIILRHKKAAMYRPSVESYASHFPSLFFQIKIIFPRFAMTLVGIPTLFVELMVYSIIVYFIIQLQQTAGQFLCVTFVVHQRILS